jgi:hypothetical protein
MYRTTHLYGHPVKPGLKEHMMYTLQHMQTEQQPKDTRKKVVLGENQRLKEEKGKKDNGTFTLI